MGKLRKDCICPVCKSAASTLGVQEYRVGLFFNRLRYHFTCMRCGEKWKTHWKIMWR